MHRFPAGHRSALLSGLAACAVLGAVLAVAWPAGSHRAPTVYAAASLRSVLPALDGAPSYSFAGSDVLQTQIERGGPADVFAAASAKQPQALFAAGRCDRPVTFATNRLVLVVPAAGGAVRSLATLRSGGRRLAVGTPGVPVGAYTRTLLDALGATAVLARNTVSQEKDVASVLAKVALGSADAGFVYHTDALTARGRVREIALPARGQPPVTYQLCAVRRGGADRSGARAFIRHITGPDGRRALAEFGFGLPPRG
ncbi:MAG TPA: molybdate ABC transporter substrate-binding protein [Baekduia sp.]|nr:molybdate ABC transporter substrate-binding protein [Baekduia sp.]